MPEVVADDTAKEVRQRGIPFKSGQQWNGNARGRPKGSRNKLGESFLTALQEDFDAHGVKAIQTVREERPHEYLKVVASILPKELNVNTNALGDMSDDELAAIIAAMRALADSVDTALVGSGAGEAESAEQAEGLSPVH